MAKRKRIRRSREDGVAAAMSLANKGPFTSGELAVAVGFTSNRARQLLEELRREQKLVTLGNRRSRRGKPSTLWGLPGTELTEEDMAPKPKAAPPKPKAPVASAPAEEAGEVPAPSPTPAARTAPAPRSPSGGGSGASFFERVWKALLVGVEIEDPDGKVFTIRLARESKN